MMTDSLMRSVCAQHLFARSKQLAFAQLAKAEAEAIADVAQ
jgi:hypothetical protein